MVARLVALRSWGFTLKDSSLRNDAYYKDNNWKRVIFPKNLYYGGFDEAKNKQRPKNKIRCEKQKRTKATKTDGKKANKTL